MAVVFKNNAKTTLSAGITSSATSITVTDGSVFPSLSGGDVFFLTLDDLTNNEIVKCTAISGNTLTVVRAQEGTTARAFSANNQAELRITAGILGLFSQTDAVITDEIEAYLDANGLTFPDNVIGKFGSSNDLQIYHDGSNSHIKDSGTGELKIASDTLRITNAAGNETSAKFVEDSFVELFHNNVSKFKTESTGIRVEATGAHSGIRGYGTSPGVYLHDTDSTTGWHMSSNGALYFLHDTDGDGAYNSIAGYFDTGRNWNIYSGALKMGASPLTIISSGRVLQNLEAIQLADNKELRIGTGNDLVIDHNGTDSIIKNNEGDLVFKQEHDDKDIIFQADDGSGGVTQYFRLDGSLAKTYFEKNVQFNDSVKIQFGAGADLSLNHNGTHSFIDNNTGSLYISSTNSVQIEDNSGNDMITAAVGGAVTLFHNGSSKLATTSSGIDVTGAISSGTVTSSSGTGFVASSTTGTGLTTNNTVYLRVIAPAVESGHTTKHELSMGWSSAYDRTYQAPKIDGTFDFNDEFGYNFAEGNWYFEDKLRVGNLNIGSINVIDSSRNLTNIGTISATGLSVASDTDTISTLGRAKIGAFVTDYAYFSHIDNATSTAYALNQNSAGSTSINAQSGQNVALKINNSSKLFLSGTTHNVGINTTSPSEKLHINGGSSDVALRVDTTNADPKIRLTTLGQQDWTLGVDYSDSGKFKINESGTVGTLTALTIDASRNVGIGTETPAYRLDLGTTPSTFRLVSQDGGTAIRIGTGGGSSDVVLLRVDGMSSAHDGETDSGAFGYSFKYFGLPSGNANRFGLLADNQTGTQVEAFSILQDGKMGINNTNPTARLDVTGGIKASGDLVVSTTNLVVDVSTDRVGMGTSTPTRPLHVKDNDDVTAFFESTDANSFVHIKDTVSGISIGSDSSGHGVFAADIDQVGNKNILFKNAGATKATLNTGGSLDTLAGYSVGTTQVIDSSRNIVNVGTISSGAITGSSSITALGTGDQSNSLAFQSGSSTNIWKNISIRRYLQQSHADALSDGTHLFTASPGGSPTDAAFAYGAFIIQCRDNSNTGFAVRIGNGSGVGTAFRINSAKNAFFTGSITSGAISASTNTTLDGVKVSGNNAPVVQVTNGQTSSIARMMAQTTYSSVGTASNHPLQLRTNDTTALTIDTSQQVGIGTSSPGARLQINGSTSDTTATALVIRNSSGNSLFSVRNDGRVDMPQGAVNITNDLTVSGNLTVNGTTTTLNTATLDVEDKNITLNYSTGDSSGSANGAGFTIQDAVSAGNDATLLWDATYDRFAFSHGIKLPDSQKLLLGDGSDFQLEHNSAGDSVINNLTGDLYITNKADDKDIIFRTDDGSGGFTTYLQLDGSDSRLAVFKETRFYDSVKAVFGNSADLQIYHDATNSVIWNQTGHLTIQNTSDDKDIIFRSDDGSGGLADYLTIDGSAGQTRFNANALFFDNKYLLMGDGADLQMAHTGSHALITNATGNIDITNNADDGDMFFKSDDGSGGVATYIQLDGGTGKVNLRHYGNKKLETTSTGIDVTGGLVVDHGNWTSSDVVNVTTDQFDAGATFQTGEFLLFGDHDGSADKMLALKRAGTDVFMVDRSGQVGIGTDSPSQKLHVAGNIYAASGFVNSSGYQLNGTYIVDSSRNLVNINTLELTGGTNYFKPRDINWGNYSFLGQTGSGAMTILGHNAFVDTTTNNTVKAKNNSWYASFIKMYYNQGITFHTTSGTVTAGDTLLSGTGTNSLERFKITSGGDIQIKTGDLQIGSTTVIDSSRNFTANNINLTSELNFTGNGNKYIDVETLALSNALTIRHHNPSGNLFETAMIMYANGGTIINYDGSGRLSTTSAGASITGSLNITSAITHNTHGTILDSSANLTNINNVYASGYRIGSTQIVDSSRNLTNIGTISSGAITSTGASSLGSGTTVGSVELDGSKVGIAEAGLLFQPNASFRCIHPTSLTSTAHSSDISLGFSNNKFKDIYLAGFVKADSGYQIGTTTVIDSSRNFTPNEIFLPEKITHYGDNDTYIQFHGNDLFRVVTGGLERFEVSNSGIRINENGSDADFIIESDNDANMFFVDGGNDRIGIGTSSPSEKLSIAPDTDVSAEIGRAHIGSVGHSDYAGFAHVDRNTTGHFALMQHGSGETYLNAAGGQNINFRINNSAKMILKDSGNFGIGTISPFSKVQIGANTFNGTHGSHANDRVNLSSNGALKSIMYASTYNSATYPDYGMIFVHGPDTSNYNVWSISPDGPAKGDSLNFIYGDTTSNIHTITPKVVFDGSGNVGIGTDNPAVNLHVQSSAPKLRLTDSDTNADSDISASSSNGSLFLSADTNNEVANSVLAFQVDGATKAYIGTDGLYTQSGANSNKILDNSTRNLTNIGTISSGAITSSGALNVGIGANGQYMVVGGDDASNGRALKFTSSTSGGSVGAQHQINASSTNGVIALATNSTNRMFISKLGFVGIGTATPPTGFRFEIAHGTDTSDIIGLSGGHTGRRLKIRSFTNSGFAGAGFLFNADSAYGAIKFQTTSTDRVVIDNAGHFDLKTGNYKVNGTTVIDSSRNLHNIGTFNGKLSVSLSSSHTTGTISSSNAILDLYNPLEADTDEKGTIITFSDNYYDGNYNKTTRAAIKGGTDTTGNTSNGFLAFYTDSGAANTANERARFDSSGKFGIGTTNPTHGLTVVGSADSDASSYISINDPNNVALSRVLLGVGGDGDGQITLKEDGNSTTVFINSEGNSYFNGGNVGIGTNNPANKLDVVGTIYSQGGLRIGSSASGEGIFRYNPGAGSGIAISTQLFTTAGIKMFIAHTAAGGGVGIGTTDPEEKLEVAGNIRMQSAISTTTARPAATVATLSKGEIRAKNSDASDGGLLRLSAGAGTNLSTMSYIDLQGYSSAETGNGKHIIFGTSGSDKMIINSSGNVGINETSPVSKLHITGTSGGWDKHITIEHDGSDIGKIVVDTDGMKFRNMSSGNGFYFRDSANATQMIIKSSGEVGIGTATPAHALSIAGTGTLISSASTGFNIGTSGSSFFGTLTGQALNASAYGISINSTQVISSARVLENITTAKINGASSVIRLTDSNITDANHNTLVAYASAQNKFALGVSSTTGTSADIVIDGANDRVGIGKIPSVKLDVNGQIRGSGQLELEVDGNDKARFTDDQSNYIEMDGGAFEMDFALDGTVQARMFDNGNFHIDGTLTQNSTQVPSDIRLKKNITPINNALSLVDSLKGVHFDWRKDDKKAIGFIAQEVEEVLPELVSEVSELHNREEKHKTVDYQSVIPVLVEAIKEQQGQIEALQAQINKIIVELEKVE